MASVDLNGPAGSYTPTQVTSPADGTLQVATAAGGFGAVLLGAPGATTGVKLVASNSALTLTNGAGGSATYSATSFTSSASVTFNSSNGAGSGMQLGAGGAAMFVGKQTGINATYNVTDGTGTAPGYLIQGVYTVTKAGNYTITGANSATGDNGTHFVFTAAATATLPTPALGLAYPITNLNATALVVTTPSGTISGAGLAGAASRNTSQAGANALFVCNDGANWIMRGKDGTWT